MNRKKPSLALIVTIVSFIAMVITAFAMVLFTLRPIYSLSSDMPNVDDTLQHTINLVHIEWVLLIVEAVMFAISLVYLFIKSRRK